MAAKTDARDAHEYSTAVKFDEIDETVRSWDQEPVDVSAEVTALPSGAEVLMLHGLLREEEIQDILRLTADADFHPGHSDTRVRDCSRLLFHSAPLAATLWSRAQAALVSNSGLAQHTLTADHRTAFGPSCDGTWEAKSLNDHFRLCHYAAGGHFGPHNDASYEQDSDNRSLLTFMLYLTDAFDGGGTAFLDPEAELHRDAAGKYLAAPGSIVHQVQPVAGSAVVFLQCNVLHCGEAVQASPGTAEAGGPLKYILRTDVMFERVQGTAPQLTPKQIAAREALAEAQRLEAAGEFARAITHYQRAERLDRSLVI